MLTDERLGHLRKWCESLKDTDNPLYAYDAATTQSVILAYVPALCDTIAELRHRLAAVEAELEALRKERDDWEQQVDDNIRLYDAARQEVERLKNAITEHHRQKADDRCIEDDDRLYTTAGLPPCDRRVGSKEAMIENCRRFIEKRCEGGGWPTYVELEKEVMALRILLQAYVTAQSRMLDRWSDSDEELKKELWKNLHKCEVPARAALAAGERKG